MSRGASARWCVAAAIALLAGCAGEQPDETPAVRDPLFTGAPGEDTLSMAMAARQRALLEMLADTTADPSAFVDLDFILRDAADPADTLRREFAGRTYGQDYFRALARRLSPDHAAIERLEVLPQSGSWVTVVTYHPQAGPTVTHWGRSDGEWKARLMSINMTTDRTAEFVQRVRADMDRRRRTAGR